MLTDHNNLLLQSAEKILWVEQSYLRLKSLLHKIPFESVLLQSTSTDMPSSLSFARTNSRSLELPFLTISNFDGASSVKVESGIKRSFMQ